MNHLINWLRNNGTNNAKSNAQAVEEGYNPYIPGDKRHEIIEAYKNEKTKIEINILQKLLGKTYE